MGLSLLLEKSILIAEEQSNGVVSCNGGGMEPFTGGSGATAWESMGWSCNGCRGAGRREFVGSLSAISTSVGCDAFQSEFTNEGIMVEIVQGLVSILYSLFQLYGMNSGVLDLNSD
jgi:hypothetical protein